MTAFLKIDRCASCGREIPWDWVAPAKVGDKLLAGTGVWRSALSDGLCADCVDAAEQRLRKDRQATARRKQFIRMVGVKPYRRFTFGQYRLTADNRAAFDYAQQFDASTQNLYLWGSCGVGKTHLAVAILRSALARGTSISLVTPFQLVRKLRMKTPEDEQQTVDAFARVGVLVIDDLGTGTASSFGRQALQEILDARDFHDRAGLVITSQWSPERLANRWNDRAIPSRLNGMCRVLQIKGADGRAKSVS